MSNITTSASGEPTATISSDNYTLSSPAKRKRNLPGNPDPDAEVVALSPKSLMATNRFVCQVCNKGFQRDQNLQLHRRGHNLPWKLRQRIAGKESKKRVYICPETTCVHHNPSRALGDLTGIKKHFSRKHGEKKWKCEKCSKTYAVQSDWKAHFKTCGTREYRCDCGTLFSRRDSFITHRAFCDALAQEKAIVNSSSSTPAAAAAAAHAIMNSSSNSSPLVGIMSNPIASPFLTPHQPRPMLIIPPSNYSHTSGVQNPSLAGLWPLTSSSTMGSVYSRQKAMDLSVDGMDVGAATNWRSTSAVVGGRDILVSASTSLPSMYGHDEKGNERRSSSTGKCPDMSATALLQKAAQMGVKPGGSSSYSASMPMERDQKTSSFVQPHAYSYSDTEKANAGLQDMMKSFVGSFNAEKGLDGMFQMQTSFGESNTAAPSYGGLIQSSNNGAHHKRVLQVDNQKNGKASGEESEGITRDFLGVGLRVVLNMNMNMGAYKNLLE